MREYFKEQIDVGATLLFYAIENYTDDEPTRTIVVLYSEKLDSVDNLSNLEYIRNLVNSGIPLFKKIDISNKS
jgi:hypothetical protein